MIAALLFLTLGIYLTVSSWDFPGGIGGLPGPGLFPRAIGILMMLLAPAALRDRGRARVAVENGRTIAGTVVLTAAYLLLWGTGWFAIRTVLYLVALLRLYGQPWRSCAAVAAVLTAAVLLGFQLGLRLTLE